MEPAFAYSPGTGSIVPTQPVLDAAERAAIMASHSIPEPVPRLWQSTTPCSHRVSPGYLVCHRIANPDDPATAPLSITASSQSGSSSNPNLSSRSSISSDIAIDKYKDEDDDEDDDADENEDGDDTEEANPDVVE